MGCCCVRDFKVDCLTKRSLAVCCALTVLKHMPFASSTRSFPMGRFGPKVDIQCFERNTSLRPKILSQLD
eukprot:1156322-Amphidinium_carterae.2